MSDKEGPEPTPVSEPPLDPKRGPEPKAEAQRIEDTAKTISFPVILDSLVEVGG
jgi:hypothetical protein